MVGCAGATENPVVLRSTARKGSFSGVEVVGGFGYTAAAQPCSWRVERKASASLQPCARHVPRPPQALAPQGRSGCPAVAWVQVVEVSAVVAVVPSLCGVQAGQGRAGRGGCA
jgi:hypothetical protein